MGILKNEIENDYFGTLEVVAKTGFKEIEIGRRLANTQHSRDEMKAKLDSLGLRVLTMHIKIEDLKNDFEDLIEEATFCGAKYLDVVWSPFETLDWILETCEFLDAAALRAAEHGFVLTYHNHDHEVNRFFDVGASDADGSIGASTSKRGIEILVENTKYLKFLVDTCWIKVGGLEPQEFLKTVRGRCPILHVKDIRDVSIRDSFIEVGDGIIDFPAVIAEAKAGGCTHFVVEQDRAYLLSPFESIRRSYDYLARIL